MPEVLFTVRLPDGVEMNCYSPSSVVKKHFQTGEEMPMREFLARSRISLNDASERVRAKFGYACSSALDQLAAIEHWATVYPPESTVSIVTI